MPLKVHLLFILLGLTLAGAGFAGTARPQSTTPQQPSLRSEPLKFNHPLRSDVTYPGGMGLPWMAARNAWVSRDGRYVTFFAREAPADEGASRRLVVKDVDKDLEVFSKSIHSGEESLRQGGVFLDNSSRAHAWEAMTQVDEYGFQPMASQQVTAREKVIDSYGCYEEQIHTRYSLALEQLKVSYQEPRLQVWRQGKKLLDRQFPEWSLHKDGCQLASPSWMNKVFADPAHGVVLVELEFCGMDHCLEPASAFHVVRIPADTPRGGGGASAGPERASVPIPFPPL